ncbi:MAG TPA: HAD family phosphatase [Deltaproteobacteria bacterium]|nr:HAD family phosphatase [Deltaproteobacteria bacterium]
MFKVILWDNDGVLVDTEKFYYLANKKLLSRYGVNLTEDLFRDLYLTRSIGAWHLIPKVDSESMDIPELKKERNAIYLRMLQTEEFRINGVEEALTALKEKYIMGIVTSSRREHFEMIHSRTGFIRFFKLILTNEDYDKSKPDPEPYLKALEMLETEPKDGLVIEDSERGLIAAKRAGMTCWVIPNHLSSHGDFSKADKILSNIGEVAELLLDHQR